MRGLVLEKKETETKSLSPKKRKRFLFLIHYIVKAEVKKEFIYKKERWELCNQYKIDEYNKKLIAKLFKV